MSDTCAVCGAEDIDLNDDPHWSDLLECWICSDCCAPCSQSSDGSGPEPDYSDRASPSPGDHDTPSAPTQAGVAVSAAIRAPRSLCPESEKRAAMTDGEFWSYVLLGVEPDGTVHDFLPDWEPWEQTDWPDQIGAANPCPVCGSFTACGVDDAGRPMIHCVEVDT